MSRAFGNRPAHVRESLHAEAVQIESRTFLALTRAAVSGAEGSDVSLCILCTSLARCLLLQLLVEIPNGIAADAAELPRLGLEEA